MDQNSQRQEEREKEKLQEPETKSSRRQSQNRKVFLPAAAGRVSAERRNKPALITSAALWQHVEENCSNMEINPPGAKLNTGQLLVAFKHIKYVL